MLSVSHRNRYARLAGHQAGGAAVKAGTAAKKEVYIALQVHLTSTVYCWTSIHTAGMISVLCRCTLSLVELTSGCLHGSFVHDRLSQTWHAM